MATVEQSTAAGLYEAIKSSLEEKKIPIKNIIRCSSDTTNAMFGEHESVVSLLKKDAPYVFAVKCSCHVIHLCASHDVSKCRQHWKICARISIPTLADRV